MTQNKKPLSPDHMLRIARGVLLAESNGIQQQVDQLNLSFVEAVHLMLNHSGRVIVTGMGKSGHIGRKISATLTSLGTPACFMHATEANHGDLGFVCADDILLVVSHSGTSEDILSIVPEVRCRGVRIIGMSGHPDSPLAKVADVHILVRVAREACPCNIAPTVSTTAVLAIGDALAVVLFTARGLGEADFVRSHPGGRLGRRLLTQVRDIMCPVAKVPVVQQDTLIHDMLWAMTQGCLGMVVIVEAGQVVGIFTDGDLRRVLEKKVDVREIPMRAVMTTQPWTIAVDRLAYEAAVMMEAHKITQLVVLDAAGQLGGVLHVHHLLVRGII